MKKFILYCILLFLVVIVIATGLLGSQYIMANKSKWRISENKTTLFMGASHVTHAVDDGMLENALNISLPSERYPFTYLKLQKLLSDGNKIEHVVLQCAPTDLSRVADKKIFDANNEMLVFVPLFFPYFSKSEWYVYKNYSPDVIKIILSRGMRRWTLSSSKLFSRYGGYEARKEVFSGNVLNEDEIRKVDELYYGNDVNLNYFRKIIETCRLNDIRLTLLYCPVYKPELYYDQAYYRNVLKTKFGDIEFLDYSDLSIPDDYRADPHHLNERGALHFTKIMASDLGLRCKSAAE